MSTLIRCLFMDEHDKYKDTFEICARAVIRHRGKVLVCLNKNDGFYFFPGGHIDFGEKAMDALVREIKEELNISVKKASLIGTVENIFGEKNQKHHEIDFVFDVKTDKISKESKEDHIDFVFLSEKDFKEKDVLPHALKESLLVWFKNKKVFWASQIYDKIIKS